MISLLPFENKISRVQKNVIGGIIGQEQRRSEKALALSVGSDKAFFQMVFYRVG